MDVVNRNEEHQHVCQSALFLTLVFGTSGLKPGINWKDEKSYVTCLECKLQFDYRTCS